MNIAISIVIPTFQRPGLLYRCLGALYRQDFDHSRFEVIVVADGPDPATEYLLRHLEIDGLITRFLALNGKRGPAAARNAGWCLAFGELVLFTDDDCVPAPDWVEGYWEAYQAYKLTSRLDWVFGECVALRGPLTVPCPYPPTDYEKNTAGLEKAGFVTANCACSVRALRTIGGFDESFTMAWREDSDLEFKLVESGIPIVTVPRARVIHPVRSAPWGVSLKEQKKSLFNALLYKKHPQLFRRRIYRRPFWNYYATIFLLLLALAAFSLRQSIIAFGAIAGWLLLTADFTRRRLRGTSHSPMHVAEMIVTSILIPFLSIYWTLYGAIRYKTFFL